MRTLALLACLVGSMLFGPPAALAWDLPQQFAWQSPCGEPQNTAALIKGCYFGKAGSTKHAGLAFFRICGAYKESVPFLIAYFDKNMYEFNRDAEGRDTEIGPLSDGPASSFTIDPAPFFANVEEWRGTCRGGQAA